MEARTKTSGNTVEIIPGRLYWISDKNPPKSRKSPNLVSFTKFSETHQIIVKSIKFSEILNNLVSFTKFH